MATVRKFQRLLLIALYVSTTNYQGGVYDLWIAFIDMASGPQKPLVLFSLSVHLITFCIKATVGRQHGEGSVTSLILFIYLLTFGCAGSLLLCSGSL